MDCPITLTGFGISRETCVERAEEIATNALKDVTYSFNSIEPVNPI